tara:strand:+ start:390 stop:2918 length:2529 start_codon:yes stop_codon:yes gene_type:complete
MKLSKIEIKGFKSFGDKTIINFNDGVTGVVGPNGCGKSNVVDAIRWVLGEQKTTLLRSDKMENIIFNGSKSRKKLNLAEVSITFDNTKNLIPTEYSNVSITRKYFRSGESEYFLNDIKCRLKDITNLFLDTGITSNNYAIIELSMVDNILNDKDNSRMKLFEEASGISKFKKRKKETLNKIDYTDKDLERVDDLIHEIEKNLRSLKRQSEQTKKFYELKDKYKKLSINLAIKTTEEKTIRLNKLKTDLKKIEINDVKLSSGIAKKNANLESLKSSLISFEKELMKKQKIVNDKLERIRKHEENKKIKKEKLKFLEIKSDELNKKIKLDEESNSRSLFSIESIKKEILQEENSLQKLSKKLNKTKEEFSKFEKEIDNKQIKTSSLDEINENFRSINFNLKSIQEKKNQIISLIQIEEMNKKEIILKLNSFEKKIDEILSNVNFIEKSFSNENKELIKLNKQFTKKSKDLSNEEILFNKIKNKINSLTNELDYKSSTYDYNLKQIKNNKKELLNTKDQIKNSKNITSDKDNLLIDLYNQKDKLEIELNNYENDYQKTRDEIDKIDAEIKLNRDKKEQNLLLINEHKNEIHDLELDLNSVSERIKVEFELNILDLKLDEGVFENKSIEIVENIILKTKEKIDKIGQINPLALETYNEMKERHEFITKEKNDLLEAKESLLKTITEIDKNATETFLDSFEKIKKYFKDVFRSLFIEDDDCDLILSDHNSPLESSIDILAKPKGKKPISINQLSGGEKTLTATSLLFAIYLLKPAPFCIFDEVDAPLDDNNIDKFNRIIKKFSKDSQFIIVTHNKRTMMNTDIIYGITMPEQGVSKVVPVDLRNLNL